MFDRIAQVAIPVRDLSRATAFYRDVVGLPLLFEVSGMAFFDCGGVRVLVGAGDPATPHTGTLLYFHAKDITAAINGLREGGATIEREPQMIAKMPDREVWLALFQDLDGNTIQVMSEVPL